MTAATPSSEACSCHRTTGSAPASSSAWTVSRSQLLPGKTTAPTRAGIPVLPCPDTDRGRVRRADGPLGAAADPDATDALDPEVAEAALDGPALRVEDPGLRRDVDR